MQFNTMLRVGSLALNVAQDEKIRELATIIHRGAKRRGIIGPIAPPATSSAKPVQMNAPADAVSPSSHPIPFSPTSSANAPVPDVGKYLNMNNAKKVLGWAGQISSLLTK